MSIRPLNFTRWLTPTRATSLLRATQISRPALRPFSLNSISNSTSLRNAKLQPKNTPFQRNPRSYQKRFNSNNTNPNAQKPGQGQSHQQQSKEPSGLSARLKKLTREYGWAALGVYLTLSALDFPFCFAAVRLLGVERIGHFEHVILGYLKGVLGPVWPGSSSSSSSSEGGESTEEKQEGEGEGDAILGADGNAVVTKAEEASIWTQLVFAYAIHKSLLIFVRVPLTAAVTPKVVKVLRRWGWDIGKRAPKSS